VLGAMDFRTEAGEKLLRRPAAQLPSQRVCFRVTHVGPGASWRGAVAWMDAGKERTEARLGEVAPGSYQAIRFAVGLDAEGQCL